MTGQPGSDQFHGLSAARSGSTAGYAPQSFANPCAAGLSSYYSMAAAAGLVSTPSTAGPAALYPAAATPPPTAPPPPPHGSYCALAGSESPALTGCSNGGAMAADISDIWRGSSIATLRKKAIEHQVSAAVNGGLPGFI